MYELGRVIFIGGLILAGIMLVITILLFFLLKIPSVIGDLTGSTARKAIADIHTQNQQAQHKVYNTATLRKERKLSERISERLGRTTGNTVVTGALKTPPPATIEPPIPDSSSSAQAVAQATQSVDYGETSVLAPESGETSVLAPESGETSVLSSSQNNTDTGSTTILNNSNSIANASFVIEYDITFVHSNEIVS